MPNWCENMLTVSGPIEDVQKFKLDGYLDDEQFLSAEKFLPTPQELLEKDAGIIGIVFPAIEILKRTDPQNPLLSELLEMCKITNPDNVPHDWDTWRCSFWGTMWDLCDFSISKDEWFKSDTNSIRFDTAHNPPKYLFGFIAEQYPTLSFKLAYMEVGMFFSGYLIWEDGGEVVSIRQNEITREFVVEHMGYSPTEIDEMFYCEDEFEDEDVTA